MGTYTDQVGSISLRSEVVDKAVKQVAARQYKFKQAVAISSTSAWKNTFHREETDIPSGQTGNAFKGIPRGANFPQYALSWEEISVRITKFGAEDNILWEDILSDDIPVQARTIIKLTSGVTKAVDDHIWDKLTEDRGMDGVISSFSITGYRHWDNASAAILDDLMHASRLIAEANYDVSDLMCFISPYDKQSIMTYLADKGAQWPSIATGVAKNGVIGQLAGITLIESNSVSASYALVVKPKICATWRQLVPLKSWTTEDPGRSLRVRIVEEGALELTDPKCCVLIANTKAA